MQPLQNLRILNLAYNLPGPYAARRLQEWGAHVVKIEPPDGDPFARYSPEWYAALTNEQDICQLDLKQSTCQDILNSYLMESDLLITSLRPSSLTSLGLDWPTLHELYPDLCQVAIVGYPEPESERPGHDLTYMAETGLLRPPEMSLTLMSDLVGAEKAIGAALALLLGKARGFKADIARVALADAAMAFVDPLHYRLTQPGDLLNGGSPRYRIYPAKEGWVALAALEEHFWHRLLMELNIAGTPTDIVLGEVFQDRTAQEWHNWARDRDLPLVKVQLW